MKMQQFMHRQYQHLLRSSWLLILTVGFTAARFTLDPISVLYVPYGYDTTTGDGLYKLVSGASEQSSYDYKNHVLYIAGDRYIHVVNVTNATNPDIVHFLEINYEGDMVRANASANDIEVCGEYVGFVQNGVAHKNAQGTLHLYRLYDPASGNWTKIFEIPVGSVPDMLQFTKDCQTIVVVNEGEYGVTSDPDVFIDPEGTITIIRLNGDGYTINHINFTDFNERAEEYEARGVRNPYKNSSFSQNLEPEYIALSSDDSKAYVALQENNAIAVIDIQTETILDIYPLGAKSWKNLRLDASNRDGGIHFGNYDIYSYYQPDAIKYFEVGGNAYIATANEGAIIDYPTWTEEKRGKSLVEDGLVWAESPLVSALNDTTKLGRLKFTQYDGANSSRFGKLDTLYFFGGRSISIRSAVDLSLVYDTGDEVEVKSSEELTNVFNTDTKPLDGSPADASDQRSDDFGPECESLAFGEMSGTRLLFVGVERLSALIIYTFAPNSPTPVFDSFYRAGGRQESYNQLLEDRNLGDLDPEDIKFLPGEKSPTGRPFLIVTNNIASTIAFYDVIDEDDNTATYSVMTNPTSKASRMGANGWIHSIAIATLLMILHSIFFPLGLQS